MKTMKKNQEAFVKTLSHPETELRAQAIRWMMEKMLICALFVDAMVLTGNNRSLGYPGHVQRSRAAQIRGSTGTSANGSTLAESANLCKTYRVVGHRGCQVRSRAA